MSEGEATSSTDFVRQIVAADVAAGKNDGQVQTRFPPEPNGYLHVGHAKSICLNFGIAQEFGGKCNLRFDDTNPVKEDTEYVESIKEDVRWLGFQWDGEFYASDYFPQLYDYAIQLVKAGKAYVDSLSAEEIRKYRGTLTEPGKPSPYRDRPVEENLDLLERMKQGEFEDGQHVLRAKIDMASSNINLRDPALYRIRKAHHHRTGDAWCIYPMYDFAHGYSDSIEKVTHSICTLEFENHRPLYDWLIEQVGIHHPQQIEFARLNLTQTVMSKRKLLELVQGGHVRGWDDPRMPTIAGMRRRGYPPEAVVAFCKKIGVAKYNSTIDFKLLEHVLREDLNQRCLRRLGVKDPLKLVITNYPEGEEETFDAVNNPEHEAAGTREVPFARELWIEREDFIEKAPNKKWKRMALGVETRLRYACLVTAQSVVKDDAGNVVEVHCTWDPESRGGSTPDNRKVKGTIHWVSAKHAVEAELRVYKPLLRDLAEGEEEPEDWKTLIDPESETVVQAWVEPSIRELPAGANIQLERVGYFFPDKDSTPERPVFNETVPMRAVALDKIFKQG